MLTFCLFTTQNLHYTINQILQNRFVVHLIYEMYILVLLFHYFIVSYAIAFKSRILFFNGGCVANKSAHQPS